jgi:hypothetical protein
MKDTFCKRTYKCKCKAIVEDFAWESQLKETQFMCNKCGNWVGFEQLKIKQVPQTASIRTPTKNR